MANITPGNVGSPSGFTTGISPGGVFTGPNSGSVASSGSGGGTNANIADQLAAILARLAADEAALAQEILNRIAGDDALSARITTNANGLAAEIVARADADALLQGLIDTNIIAIAANTAEILTKQDTLIAGTNITLVDNGDDTTTINSTGGGGGTGTAFSVRIDFTQASGPMVVTNTLPNSTVTVDINADSILVSGNTWPSNTQVSVNGIPFINPTDFTISSDSSIINFVDYVLENNDGDVIILTGTYT